MGTTKKKTWRIGCVSYLNARPLVWQLDQNPAVQMLYDVPARLLGHLQNREVEVALLPIIDYQCGEELMLVPGTCIGADGPVHTVRLFSQVPIGQIKRMYADVESHTSVVLCRLVLKIVYGIAPEVVSNEDAPVEARLLIGDKVVCRVPQNHPHQLDLAEAWKQWTGLPFVFAAWIARQDAQLQGLPNLLRQTMAQGMQNIDLIIASDAIPRGWGVDIARDYLTHLLHFPLDLTPGSLQRRAIELFQQLAWEAGAIKCHRPISVLSEK